MYIMWLSGKPVLYIVGKGKVFQNAIFINRRTSQESWHDFKD